MGHGVVQLCASSGYEVIAVDLNDDACTKAVDHIKGSLDKVWSKKVAKGKVEQADADSEVDAILGRITTTTNLEDMSDADLIIEAIAENREIKLDFFGKLGEIAKEGAILATNTSSFSVSDMAQASGRPSHTIGLHYFNPVQLMQLVEVVCTDEADQAVIDSAFAFVEHTKKVPIKCSDTRGFIVNRLLIPYIIQV